MARVDYQNGELISLRSETN